MWGTVPFAANSERRGMIQSQCELGIEATFWQNEANDQSDKGPDVLPLVRPG
jgi:hypothetical protein